MNKSTRNAIALAIAPHTGHGRTRTRDYFPIIEIVREFGYRVTDKVADDYSADMTHKHNAYRMEDVRTDKEVDAMLVIDEYFTFDDDGCKPYEISAYVS